MISVCVGVMYSGEYDVCDVTLSVHPRTPGNLKSLPDHGGNRTRDFWDTSPTVVRKTFQFARVWMAGCTCRVTSQTSYSPEYITPTHTEIIIS